MRIVYDPVATARGSVVSDALRALKVGRSHDRREQQAAIHPSRGVD